MRVSFQQIATRGFRMQCPNCGGPLVFAPRMRLLEKCPQCGLRWTRDGFFLGAMVWNYSVTVFGLLSIVVFAAFKAWLSVPVAIVVGFVIALIFPWVFYKFSWSLWLTSYYLVLPNELPANAGEEHPALHHK
jgi:uncharacterized protein (DUF983 family)